MRLTKTIDIQGGTVTVNELTVSIGRNLIADFKSVENLSVKEFLGARFNECIEKLTPLLEFSEGAGFEGLSFSEVIQVRDAFMEVNAAFLELMGLADILRAVFYPPPAPLKDPAEMTGASPETPSGDPLTVDGDN